MIDELMTSSSIPWPAQHLADLLCHLQQKSFSFHFSSSHFHRHLVEGHVSEVESVHPVDNLSRVVRLSRFLQDSHYLQLKWGSDSFINVKVNEKKNHLRDFISHALGKVVSIFYCLICTLALLQQAHIIIYDGITTGWIPANIKLSPTGSLDQQKKLLNGGEWHNFALLTWFKIWMKIFMLQMRMGARVLICSRCWPRLSRWLGFKRSFWRPSTSWDTWVFQCFKRKIFKKIFRVTNSGMRWSWLIGNILDWPLNPGPTACVPSNEWDWRINRSNVVQNKTINWCCRGLQ